MLSYVEIFEKEIELLFFTKHPVARYKSVLLLMLVNNHTIHIHFMPGDQQQGYISQFTSLCESWRSECRRGRGDGTTTTTTTWCCWGRRGSRETDRQRLHCPPPPHHHTALTPCVHLSVGWFLVILHFSGFTSGFVKFPSFWKKQKLGMIIVRTLIG